ncbi:hypothetical protein MMC34_004214 [Xylographa carneopallida]|nr:hypothetical protein [Xylographa carneopallida]
MTSSNQNKPARSGLSLYANLLDPSASSEASNTISRAPVVFKQPASGDPQQDEVSAQKQQLSAASLRFQPTKRPQITTQKPKPKTVGLKSKPVATNVSAQVATPPEQPIALSRQAPKTSIADWTGDGDEDDVNGFYGGEKRQRGGKKRRKKGVKEESHVVQNWDDIYDPSRPNNYEEYKNSDEKIREVREWKDRLYAHRMTRHDSNISDSEDDIRARPQMNNQFAPPPMSFAPPPNLNGDSATSLTATVVPDDPTGEDAYARRLRLPQIQQSTTDFTPLGVSTFTSPPPPPPVEQTPNYPLTAPPLPPAEVAPQPAASISRAPVRYNLPPPPADIPESEAELETALQEEAAEEEAEAEADAPRSLRPGQRGFAERLMSKYGWTKGSGLGASGSGIVNPLRVQVEKQKKKPDSEGGGFVGPGGRGKIIGGKKKVGNDAEAEGGKFGAMSEVVILRGMVDGMDLDAELDDGGLMQEIGEECGDKYGRVERVFIDRSTPTSAPVFVKFTSQLSALRAVNALEGRIFNGNTITARFFDTDKFEKGIFNQ